MSFRTSSVSYARFAVTGGPEAVTAELVDDLAAGRLQVSDIGIPAEIQTGWVAGRHVFDTDFAPEVLVFGEVLLFGLRLDTNRIPAEIRNAYRAMAEDARRVESPTNVIAGHERREAREEADDRCREELTSGRHRRSSLVPVLWDLSRKLVLAPAFSDAKRAALEDLFRSTFDAGLEPRSSGGLAAAILGARGRTRDYEDLSPSKFSTPPPGADEDGQPTEVPVVPWSHMGPEPKDFLGNEFLLWLWAHTAAGDAVIDTSSGPVAIVIDRLLETECAWAVSGKQTLRADAPTRWPEAMKALQIGKWPRKAGLILSAQGEQWELTFQADRFLVTSARLPKPEEAPPTERELVELRLSSIVALDRTLTALFQAFLEHRLGSSWGADRSRIVEWIRGGRRRAGPDKPAVEIELVPQDAGAMVEQV